MRSMPFGSPGQQAPSKQSSGIARRRPDLPFLGGALKLALEPQGIAIAVDPPPEPRPLADQRFVGHLDAGRPTGLESLPLIGDRDQALVGQSLQDLSRFVRPLAGSQVLQWDLPLGVGCAFAEMGQSQEKKPRDFLPLGVEPGQGLLSGFLQGAADSADLLVGGVRQSMSVAPFPELEKSMLQKRQVARLVPHVINDPLDQPILG